MKRKVLFIILGMIYFVVMTAANAHEIQSEIDIFEAIAIAETMLSKKDKRKHIEYENGILEIGLAQKYTSIRRFETINQGSLISAIKLERLEGRRFWQIYFAPSEIVVGGDIEFFIDAETSELIYFSKGK